MTICALNITSVLQSFVLILITSCFMGSEESIIWKRSKHPSHITGTLTPEVCAKYTGGIRKRMQRVAGQGRTNILKYYPDLWRGGHASTTQTAFISKSVSNTPTGNMLGASMFTNNSASHTPGENTLGASHTPRENTLGAPHTTLRLATHISSATHHHAQKHGSGHHSHSAHGFEMSSTYIIAGAAFGVFLLLLVLVVIIVFVITAKKKKAREKRLAAVLDEEDRKRKERAAAMKSKEDEKKKSKEDDVEEDEKKEKKKKKKKKSKEKDDDECKGMSMDQLMAALQNEKMEELMRDPSVDANPKDVNKMVKELQQKRMAKLMEKENQQQQQ